MPSISLENFIFYSNLMYSKVSCHRLKSALSLSLGIISRAPQCIWALGSVQASLKHSFFFGQQVVVIPDICQFWYTTELFTSPVEFTPKIA